MKKHISQNQTWEIKKMQISEMVQRSGQRKEEIK